MAVVSKLLQLYPKTSPLLEQDLWQTKLAEVLKLDKQVLKKEYQGLNKPLPKRNVTITMGGSFGAKDGRNNQFLLF